MLSALLRAVLVKSGVDALSKCFFFLVAAASFEQKSAVLRWSTLEHIAPCKKKEKKKDTAIQKSVTTLGTRKKKLTVLGAHKR